MRAGLTFDGNPTGTVSLTFANNVALAGLDPPFAVANWQETSNP